MNTCHCHHSTSTLALVLILWQKQNTLTRKMLSALSFFFTAGALSLCLLSLLVEEAIIFAGALRMIRSRSYGSSIASLTRGRRSRSKIDEQDENEMDESKHIVNESRLAELAEIELYGAGGSDEGEAGNAAGAKKDVQSKERTSPSSFSFEASPSTIMSHQPLSGSRLTSYEDDLNAHSTHYGGNALVRESLSSQGWYKVKPIRPTPTSSSRTQSASVSPRSLSPTPSEGDAEAMAVKVGEYDIGGAPLLNWAVSMPLKSRSSTDLADAAAARKLSWETGVSLHDGKMHDHTITHYC